MLVYLHDSVHYIKYICLLNYIENSSDRKMYFSWWLEVDREKQTPTGKTYFFDDLTTDRVSVHIPCRFYTAKEIIFPVGCLRFFDGFNRQRKYIFPYGFVIVLSVLHRQGK